MEKINFESLRQEDLALRQREDIVRLQESAFEQIAREEKEKVIEDVREFIARCHKAGKYIADEQERDSLRAILRYWGTFVYNTSGVYPSVDLADLEISTPKMRIKFSPVSLLVAGTLVLLAGAIASLFVLRYLSARQPPTARILQPHDKDSVPYETVVSGRYEGNLAGRNLWVIVRPQGSDRYYPQQSAEIRGDNTWFVMARFGKDTPEESGKVFDISVYLASSQADQKLRKYVNEADKTGNWPGMPSLADGLTLLDRVTVIRR